LPDVAGRRRAVFVALTVAAIVLSVIPFAASSATAPPGINRFLYALGQVESGGDYTARNSKSGAYGKYQIMPANWPGWAKLYVGSSTAPWTPVNQETVARGKVTALWNWLDTWPNVAHWWLTGSGDTNRANWSSFSRTYVERIMKVYAGVSDDVAAADVMAVPAKAAPPPVGKVVSPRQPAPAGSGTTAAGSGTRRIGETSAGIAYRGRWADARHTAYAGDHVLYSQRNGATATYPFYAKSIAWVGPVGPTRGKARVAIDGKVVATIDLRRSTFRPRATIFERSWKKVGNHTLTITVVGSGRPVAIDEFVITR
jgi:Transglycosylase-like domain